ncbi:ParB/RepB/Spo0J family partition protein [Megamonas hypermegale]|uniref:ParB/RepB/Spo0J family partition protein n=1 Tax=Megamonas hypermegale TaxID=158847 RepID=UPI0026F2A895|nr:ParB N-terminal domain-containing protein [Megamonas hypermegale]
MGFNIMESLNENRAKTAAAKTTVADKRIKTEYININDIKPYPRQNEVYGSEDDEASLQKLDELKASIKAVGVLQNIVVKENPAGGYTMLSGHRRWQACKSLAAEGYTDKQLIPATVLRNSKDIEDRFKFLTMNSTIRNKNNYQTMQEMLELDDILEKFQKDNGKLDITKRKALAEITSLSEATIAKMKAIKNNLQNFLMDLFKENKISFIAAYEASSLSEAGQKALMSVYMREDRIKLADVKYIKAEEARQKLSVAEAEKSHQEEQSKEPEQTKQEEIITPELSLETVPDKEEVKAEDDDLIEYIEPLTLPDKKENPPKQEEPSVAEYDTDIEKMLLDYRDYIQNRLLYFNNITNAKIATEGISYTGKLLEIIQDDLYNLTGKDEYRKDI